MKISEKIKLDYDGLIKYGPINIVAFGDSVTHGCVGVGEMNYDTVYFNRLKNRILDVSNFIPVNVINAGISGITAEMSVARINSQVMCHNPDLVIVCFGLNDVNGTLESYLNSLKIIFEKCKTEDTDVIFLTPNMLNTYVADDTNEDLKGYAKVTADMQNSGKMDLYIGEAIKLAESMNIKVCDSYSKWKKLSETQDTTMLLANRINHPTKEMHELFAQSLFDIIFEENRVSKHKL